MTFQEDEAPTMALLGWRNSQGTLSSFPLVTTLLVPAQEA